MAAAAPTPPALPVIESMPAAAARLRLVIDDLIHLILRAQLTTRTAMPRLPTSLTLLALATHQLLGLRASLHPPQLRARLRRIARQRT